MPKARGDHRRFVDRHAVLVVEVAPQPPSGDTRVPARILAGDQQRQLERFGEPEPADLFRRRLATSRFPRSRLA